MSGKRNLLVFGIVVLVALAMGFVGWKSYAPKDTNPTFPTTPVGTQTKPALTYTKNEKGERVHTDSGEFYDIEAVYPDSLGISATAGAASDAAAIRTLEDAIQSQIDEFKVNGNFEHITAEDKEILGFNDGRKYAMDIAYEKKESPKTVSIVFTIYVDTGGAHPNGFYQTFTWAKTGKLLKLADFFSMGKPYLTQIAALAKVQVTKALEDRGASADAVFAEGFEPTDDNFGNFYLEGSNLVILFPPYQVASYAAGPQKATIPLSALKDFKSDYK